MLISECVCISSGMSKYYFFCSSNTHLTNRRMKIILNLYSEVPRKVYNFLTKSHQVTHYGKKWEKESQLLHIQHLNSTVS